MARTASKSRRTTVRAAAAAPAASPATTAPVDQFARHRAENRAFFLKLAERYSGDPMPRSGVLREARYLQEVLTERIEESESLTPTQRAWHIRAEIRYVTGVMLSNVGADVKAIAEWRARRSAKHPGQGR